MRLNKTIYVPPWSPYRTAHTHMNGYGWGGWSAGGNGSISTKITDGISGIFFFSLRA